MIPRARTETQRTMAAAWKRRAVPKRPPQGVIDRIGLGNRPGAAEIDHDAVPLFPYKDGKPRVAGRFAPSEDGAAAPMPIMLEKRAPPISDAAIQVVQLLLAVVLCVGLSPVSPGAAAISLSAALCVVLFIVYIFVRGRSDAECGCSGCSKRTRVRGDGAAATASKGA